MNRWSRAILCVGAAFFGLGCHDLTGSGEPFSLTDRWGWTSGVDWFSYFNLRQEGTQVGGVIVYMVPGTGPIDTVAVTGSLNGRHVTLQWDEQFGGVRHYTLNGDVSRDGQTISTSVSHDGDAPTLAAPLRRQR